MKTLLVMLGPTGVGKTDTSIEVANHYHIPVINADSRQLYRELPIGTAAPTAKQQQMAKHYFTGILELEDYYNASIYEKEVLKLLENLFEKSDYAFLSGGSMMYIDTICKGIDDIPTIDDDLRNELKQKLEVEGLDKLLSELRVIDPEYYAIVDKKNPRRIIHALEIYYMTGKKYSSLRTNNKKARPFEIKKVGLNLPREILFERINKRVEKMIENGLVEEAYKVYPRRGLNSLNTVGYKELFDYFDGTTTLDFAIEKIQKHTRDYAKKQLTWFKRDDDIKWFTPSDTEEIISYYAQS